jgi:hypothetical protein
MTDRNRPCNHLALRSLRVLGQPQVGRYNHLALRSVSLMALKVATTTSLCGHCEAQAATAFDI